MKRKCTELSWFRIKDVMCCTPNDRKKEWAQFGKRKKKQYTLRSRPVASWYTKTILSHVTTIFICIRSYCSSIVWMNVRVSVCAQTTCIPFNRNGIYHSRFRNSLSYLALVKMHTLNISADLNNIIFGEKKKVTFTTRELSLNIQCVCVCLCVLIFIAIISNNSTLESFSFKVNSPSNFDILFQEHTHFRMLPVFC